MMMKRLLPLFLLCHETTSFGVSRPGEGLKATSRHQSNPDPDDRRLLTDRRAAIQSTLASAGLLLVRREPAFAAYIDPTTDMPKVTDRAYLEVQIGDDKPLGRLVIGLFGELMPRATENFLTLCKENAYAGTTFYRVLSEFTIQGGAIGDVSGKTSSSAVFEPDNYNVKHNIAGLLSTVRSGPAGGADSRFFINSVADAGWADDRYAAFGIVLDDGMDTIVKSVDKVEVKKPQNRPVVDVKITASGVL